MEQQDFLKDNLNIANFSNISTCFGIDMQKGKLTFQREQHEASGQGKKNVQDVVDP